MSKKEKVIPGKRGKPRIPKDYLIAVANRIATTNPTEEIIFNTIRAVWSDGYGKGYLRHLDDDKAFRSAREAEIKKSFDSFMDSVDDEIHSKPKQQ
jgi:hypothetical protein